MNDLINEINGLCVKLKAKEEEAVSYELKARECRAEMAQIKQDRSELLANVNDAKLVHATQSSARAAESAKHVAEASAHEMQAVLKELKDKMILLDALITNNKPSEDQSMLE